MIRKFLSDTKKVVLSSERAVYKTEGFVKATRKIASIDAFLSRAAEGIFKAGIALSEFGSLIRSEEGHCALGAVQKGKDVIFYRYTAEEENEEGGIDRGLKEILLAGEVLEFTVSEEREAPTKEELTRLYSVSGSDGAVNFPHLDETQRKIVETEDANILVQGVAGSGKTNVCVEKIVYCAARNYRGKVLYTTFSRGLLTETKERVATFEKNVRDLISAFEEGRVVFLDQNHKKAVENKLGIPFQVDGEGEIVATLKRIAAFLREKVEYRLIEDLYAEFFEPMPVAGESVFLDEYLGAKNLRLYGAIERIKNVSPEIIYKEIYGMIFGKYELSAPAPMMGREEYIEARATSFPRRECETIYAVALDYADFLKKRGYTDNNLMSRALLSKISAEAYSVGVIDEVQDFTQVNLCLIKKLSRKLFCVGDALQMINPSYFQFAYLKRLMYGEVTGVCELKHNYRSTERLERIAEKLGEMNVRRFGTHSFVLKGKSVPSPLHSEAIFIKDKSFVSALREKRFENATLIVGSQNKKERLKKTLGGMEILSVAEAKGLEREIVILADVLTDNAEKWRYLYEMSLNRKTADENSVYRYYFNLFYVGISRAKQYLIVAESDYPKFFDPLFDECFVRKTKEAGLTFLREIAGRIELGDEEFLERIAEFCAREQYENARATANRLSTEELRAKQLVGIFVHETYLRYGKYREAGVEYWRRGMDKEAREMFTRSGDEKLFPLMDACLKGGSGALEPEIVRFYPLVEDNDLARTLILETLKSDYQEMAAVLRTANATMRRKP